MTTPAWQSTSNLSLESVGSPMLWAGFVGLILVLLAVDLGLHRKAHVIGFREALGWSIFWVALSLAFNAWIWARFGSDKGLEFLTGYLIEKSLSVDNVFVFAVVFGAFAVPAQYQHRVLFWGVLGALLMRAIFIFAGTAAIARFHWILYVFGGILVLTGIKLLHREAEQVDPRRNPVFRLFERLIPATHTYDGSRFFTVQNGRRLATPLLLVLISIEITDLVFAVDSIPAIFAVTSDPFIIFTSNIFAVLGLRALYFLLASAIRRLAYLHVGLALVLVYVGIKMLVVDVVKIPTPVSLVTIVALIGAAIGWSLYRTRGNGTPRTS